MAGAGVFDFELNEDDDVDNIDQSDYSDEEPITAKEDNVRVGSI